MSRPSQVFEQLGNVDYNHRRDTPKLVNKPALGVRLMGQGGLPDVHNWKWLAILIGRHHTLAFFLDVVCVCGRFGWKTSR